MTRQQLAEIKKRLAAATPGPWQGEFDDIRDVAGDWIAEAGRDADAVFISHAPEDVRALLAAYEQVMPLLRRLYDVATWAQGCTPDTLAETFGEIGPELAQVEKILRTSGA